MIDEKTYLLGCALTGLLARHKGVTVDLTALTGAALEIVRVTIDHRRTEDEPVYGTIRLEPIKKKTSPSKFVPPTIAEASRFFRDNKSADDEAAKFWDFYKSNGWMAGKNPMKDWEASARGWIKRGAAAKVLGLLDSNAMNTHAKKMRITSGGSDYEFIPDKAGKPMWRYKG